MKDDRLIASNKITLQFQGQAQSDVPRNSHEQKTEVNRKDAQPLHKETKIKIKKLNVQFPIIFKSQEYFNTIDYGRNYIKSAMNEIDRGNLNNSLEYLETVRQYFNQIK